MHMCKSQNNYNLNVETKICFSLIYNSEEDFFCDFAFEDWHIYIYIFIFIYGA